MNEEQIANTLKQNLPPAYEPTAPIQTTPPPVGQAESAMPIEGVDEMTLYKIHEFFGEKYRNTDETTNQQAKYIYEKISELSGETDYNFIVEKMRELERIIGTVNSDRRMYKLYQWLKLDSMRRSVEAQQNALRAY